MWGVKMSFRPGIYLHYKGSVYAAHMVVRHHETREPMVVYTSLTKGNVNVREMHKPQDGRACDAWTDYVAWNQGVEVPPTYSGPTQGPTGKPGMWATRFVFLRDFE